MPTHSADNALIDTPIAAQAAAPESPSIEHVRMTTSLVYHVDSVEKTEAPGGGQGQDWYRYVLKNHRSTINGFRRGSRQHVCEYAADYADQLNTRTVLGPSPWSQRVNKTKMAPRTR